MSTVSVNAFSFITAKSFPILAEIIHMYGCMMIFATFCLIGIFFVIFVMDETKGKSLDAIAATDQKEKIQNSERVII